MTTEVAPADSSAHAEHTLDYVDRDTFVLGLGSTIPLDHPSNLAVWRNDPRFAIYHNSSSSGSSTSISDTSLKAYLASARADTSILSSAEAASFLGQEIGKRLFTLLMKPEEALNTSLPLADLRLNSLVGIELRAWWEQVFGFDTSVLEMLGMGTLEVLGQHAAKGLLQKFADSV